MATQLIDGRFRGEDAAGLPLVGGMLYTYASGTTTPKAAYTDATLGTAATNPLVLNARGEAQVWLGSGAYSLKLTDSAGVTIWTTDGVIAADSAGSGQAAADALRSDLASTAETKGASLIVVRDPGGRFASVTAEEAISKSGEWRSERLNFLDFVASATTRAQILAGTCTTLLDAEFAAFRAAIAADPSHRAGYLPAGVYPYSEPVNWAIQNLRLIGDGARLRCTGAGKVGLKIDGLAGDKVGGTPAGVFDVRISGMILEGTTSTGDGVYLRGCHWSEIDVRVAGCGSSSAGLVSAFCVLTTMRYTCDANFGWYQGVAPSVGMVLDANAVGADPGHTSYCDIYPRIAGVATGVTLAGSLGCNFWGGAIQGCTGTGVIATANSNLDKFHGTDMEANTTADVISNGSDGLALLNCDTLTAILLQTGTRNARIVGGQHVTVAFAAGSQYCTFDGVWDRLTSGGVLSDSGTKNSLAGARKSNSSHIGRPLTYAAVTIGASPVTLNNGTGDPQYITVSGGTGVGVWRGRRGAAGQPVAYVSGMEYVVESGDDFVLTFTAAPTVSAWR
jgi:hypothetical protein